MSSMGGPSVSFGTSSVKKPVVMKIPFNRPFGEHRAAESNDLGGVDR